MRKFLIPIVAAASALAVAAPASAQWAPPLVPLPARTITATASTAISFARSMRERASQRIRGDIREMQARRILSWNEARVARERGGDPPAPNLPRVAQRHPAGRGAQLENRIQRLEYRVSREASDWNGRPGPLRPAITDRTRVAREGRRAGHLSGAPFPFRSAAGYSGGIASHKELTDQWPSRRSCPFTRVRRCGRCAARESISSASRASVISISRRASRSTCSATAIRI